MYPVQIDIGIIGIVCIVASLTLVKLLVMEPHELDKIPFRKWLRGEEAVNLVKDERHA
jgi:hypothetical protein